MLTFREYLKEAEDPCWDGYQQRGMKKKGGKEVPNCIPEEDDYCDACDRPADDCICDQMNESGGEVVYKKGDDHIEKYGDHSFAVYKNGQKQTFYKSLDDARASLEEATYQGREVKLNKPMAGDVKKSKVFVDLDGDGKAKKVNFGDPNMTIKKDNPARRRSFRARHNCDNPGPKDKPRFWSCRAW